MVLFRASNTKSKIPYNAMGIAQLNLACTQVLNGIMQSGAIEPNWIERQTAVSSIPTRVKKSRIYDGLEYDIMLTGAINRLKIRINLTD
jgi:hypothetical protein